MDKSGLHNFMQINSKINSAGVNNVAPAQRRAPASETNSATEGSFSSSAALETALKNTPDVRPEAVARAKTLISDPNYPSTETVKKLSNFLAGKLSSNNE